MILPPSCEGGVREKSPPSSPHQGSAQGETITEPQTPLTEPGGRQHFSPCAWPGSPPRSMAALSGAFSENEFRPAVKFQGLPLLPAPPIALSSPPIRWGSIPPRPHLQAALLSPQCSPLLPYLPSKPSLHTFLFPHQSPASQFPPTLFLLVPCTW